MDSPVSAEERTPSEPQRLSALYQYHNAPEVAPAHGLEYDDTIYPASDKFPVIRETIHHYTGKHAYTNDNRPPRIIFGMKVRTFLVVAAIMVLVIVGAAVGGAVGGKHIHQGQPPAGMMDGSSGGSNTQSTTSKPTTTKAKPTTTSSSTFSAPTPTYKPLSDCPASDNTTYTTHSPDDSVQLTYTKYCNLKAPQQVTLQVAQAFVYSFSDCIEICASHNFINSNTDCNVAVYTPDGPRPSNCWTGGASDAYADSLPELQGSDVAILTES